MTPAPASSYEELPYLGWAFPQTHPSELAALAALFGMSPAHPARCRALELGCGPGVNLIAMAQGLPESQFLGIDLSPSQIETGQKTIAALGLKNVQLELLDIMAFDAQWGRFDYIIGHGVYSWVPAAVQDKILDLCRDSLAPQGVAYLSYNLYPAWHLDMMIREMCLFHDLPERPARERVQRCRDLLDFLAEAAPASESAYRGVLKAEAARFRDRAEPYLFHDILEDENRPVYFHEFARAAADRGLQYLADNQVKLLASRYLGVLDRFLAPVPKDPIIQEQYLDFLHFRNFRQTLLCHDRVELATRPRAEAIAAMLVVGAGPSGANVKTASSVKGEDSGAGTNRATAQPSSLANDLLGALAEVWPTAATFDALAGSIQSRRRPSSGSALDGEEDRRRLLDAVLDCYLNGLLELHSHFPHFATTAGERPQASPLARFLAASDGVLPNLRHQSISVSPLERLLLGLLDGSRDRAALLAILEAMAADGSLSLGPPGDPIQARGFLKGSLEQGLGQLARKAFLVA